MSPREAERAEHDDAAHEPDERAADVPADAEVDADVPADAEAATTSRLRAGRRRLLVVAAVLAAEAALLFGFAWYLVVNLVAGTKQTTATRNTVIETVAFFGVAGVLLLLAFGAARCRRWARSPTVLVELIALLGVGWPLLQGGVWYRYLLGVPLSVGAAAAVVLVLTPAVTAALDAED